MPVLRLRGVVTRNLKGFDIAFEPGTWTSVVGVSGSGKSSLCFHTLHAEAGRRFLAAMAPAARLLLDDLPRARLAAAEGLLPTLALEQGAEHPLPRQRAIDLAGIDPVVRGLFAARGQACSPSGKPLRSWAPWEAADALLKRFPGAKLQVMVPSGEGDAAAWAHRGFVRARCRGEMVELAEIRAGDAFEVVIDRLRAEEKFRERLGEAIGLGFRLAGGRAMAEVFPEKEESALQIFQDHPVCPDTGREAPRASLAIFSPASPLGMCPVCSGTGGESGTCSACRGSGLGDAASWYRLGGRTLPELLALPFDDWGEWLRNSGSEDEKDPAVCELWRELEARLHCLDALGLGYLEAGRHGGEVSLGEFHRLRLAHLTGFPLAGVCYVLDEPSTGLHPGDAARLDAHLRSLAGLGNTLVVVEHRLRDLGGDRVLEIGPGAGAEGGNLVCDTAPSHLRETAGASGKFLRLPPPVRPEPCTGPWLHLDGATGRNLSEASLDVPVGRLSAVCGPSGAGKSTLVQDTLVPALRRALDPRHARRDPLPFAALTGADLLTSVEAVDPGDESVANPRSMVASLAGLLDPLRKLFAGLPEAKMRGLGAERFSPNLKGGRCEHCQGLGRVRVDLPFLPTSWTVCPVCGGARFAADTLAVHWRGRDLGKILSLSCEAAAREFSAHPKLSRLLNALVDAGLGYLPLGFPGEELSGGELARLRLAVNLAGAFHDRLFVLDEPTRGLHPADTLRFTALLRALCARGHSVLAVSHDPVFLSRCDWLCEMGPGAGKAGGRTLLQGDPWTVAAGETPTAAALRRELSLPVPAG